MSEPVEFGTLTICREGHTVNYPADLEQAAIDHGTDLAFYTSCPCGGAVVMAWMGDHIRVMAYGDIAVRELEASGWPELDLGDPRIGSFYVRKVPNLGWNLLARRIEAS